MKKSLLILFLSFFLVSAFAQKKPLIDISTADSTIYVNGKKMISFHPDTLKLFFGSPSRIMKETRDSYIEEWPFEKGQPRSIRSVKITDYYYVYDPLGLVFHTASPFISDSVPVRMRIFFPNPGKFSHRKFPDAIDKKYNPLKSFPGEVSVNGRIVDENMRLFGDSVTYQSERIMLFGIPFSPTSVGMCIDRVYCFQRFPYIHIFLNDPVERKVSEFVIQ